MRSKTKIQLELSPYRYFSTAGNYVIGHGKDELTLAHMTPKQQKAMDRTYGSPKLDDALIAGGATDAIATDILGLTSHLFSLSELYTAQGIGLAAIVFATGRSHVARKQAQRTRIKLELDMPARTDVLRFPKSEIPFNLPANVLEQEVAFISETGPTERPAGELLQSVDRFMGIAAKTKKQRVVGEIRPYNLFMSLINSQSTTNGKAALIQTSFEQLTKVHEATTDIPRWGRTDMARMPEGIRASDEQACTRLFLGSLGAFAVARAQLGQSLSESIKDLYSERAEGLLIGDAHRIGNPTPENVPWSELQSTSSYLSGLVPRQ